MATADRAVVVFVKEFQWDQRPQPLQNGLIHHSTKIYLVFFFNLIINWSQNAIFQLTLSVHDVSKKSFEKNL